MSWLILSSVPVIVLLIFGRRLPITLRQILKLCCIPFIILMGFYSLILGAALMVAFIGFIKYQEYKWKKNMPSAPSERIIDINIIEHDSIDKE
jgi:hypothetical protein